jgi:hypothetical protein
MNPGRVSLALAMKLTALAALNLALVREVAGILEIPFVLFLFAALDLVIVQGVFLGRPLRTFHFTFLSVGLASSIAMTLISLAPEMGSGWVLMAMFRRFREALGDDGIILARAVLTTWKLGAGALGLLVAWAVGRWAARRGHRRGHRAGGLARSVAAFFQGAVIGFGFFSVGARVLYSIRPDLIDLTMRNTVARYLHLGTLAACTILGGLAVWHARRSRRPETRDDATEGPVGHVGNRRGSSG